MSIRSTQSGHWTDDELLAALYGVGPSGDHLDGCADCRTRLSAMQVSRENMETSAAAADGVSAAFLAAQRRAIYQRMEQPVRWWSAAGIRRLAAGVATACVLTGSIVVYENNRKAQLAQESMNDAKLAQEVAAMAQDQDTGVSAMAPLEGLFE